MNRMTFVGFAGAFLLVGCGGSKAAASGNKELSAADAGKSDMQEILAYDWKIDPGVETYYCVIETLKADIWADQYRPIATTGTHHVTIGYLDKPLADGTYKDGDDMGGGSICNGVSLGDRLAFGGVVGTGTFEFPKGVAVKLSKGQQVLLSVHVSNTSDEPLSGRSGIEVHPTEPVGPEKQAEILFINNAFISVTPGKSTQKGTCTLDADTTFFSLVHHMHKTGVHMTTRALPANGEAFEILNAPYDFNEQRFVPLNPVVKLAKGDQVEVSCDYENPGPNTLTFGESTFDSEMCIAITYRYPASAANFNCIAGQ